MHAFYKLFSWLGILAALLIVVLAVSASYGWEQWQHIEVLSLSGFALIGVALCCYILIIMRQKNYAIMRFFSIIICLTIIAIGSVIALAEKHYEQKQLLQTMQLQTESLKFDFHAFLDDYAHVLLLMAARAQAQNGSTESHWRIDATQHLHYLTAFQAIGYVRQNNIIKWLEPTNQIKHLSPLLTSDQTNLSRLITAATHANKPTISNLLSLSDGNKGLLMVVPLTKNNSDAGAIIGVLNLNKLIVNNTDTQFQNDYQLLIYENNQLAYASDSQLLSPKTLHYKTSLTFYNANWDMIIFPTAQFIKSNYTALPIIIFACALFLALLSLFLFELIIIQLKTALLAKKAQAKLKIKNQELDQFAYIASHDLKAPLRAIDNLITWIEEDAKHELKDESKKHFSLIKKRTGRMNQLITGILEYSRLGRIDSDISEVNVAALLHEVIENLGPPPQFIINILPPMPMLTTPVLALDQVFSNIISNAIKYRRHDNGKIDISATDVGEFYEFKICDNGPGIDPQYHEKIFGIFQTLNPRDKFESTGIGLAIVKKILDQQHGKIWVKSAVGKGTIFYFTWPKKSYATQDNDE